MSFGHKCCAVLAAAGASSRMRRNGSKQFLPLLGVPVIVRTLLAFEAAREVDAVVIVCRGEDVGRTEAAVRGCGAGKVTAVVPGGSTRQRSAAAGAAAVPPGTEWIAVHDGARPLVRPEEIDACVAAARECGAAALAVPVKDTIKLADSAGFVVSTPPREKLWAVQTPQVFRLASYREAMRRAAAEGADCTDDCQLLERCGVSVRLCRGSYENLKLTTLEDVVAAEAVLRRRGEALMRIGHGYDVHRLAAGRRLVLGGVTISWPRGLEGHSDADVLLHAVMDSLLGAAALGDIGGLFPDTDSAWLGADSGRLLEKVCGLLAQNGWRVGNIDATVVAQEPKLKPYVPAMRENIARLCGVPAGRVSVKATTEEGLGFTGAEDGIAAHAVCLIERADG